MLTIHLHLMSKLIRGDTPPPIHSSSYCGTRELLYLYFILQQPVFRHQKGKQVKSVRFEVSTAVTMMIIIKLKVIFDTSKRGSGSLFSCSRVHKVCFLDIWVHYFLLTMILKQFLRLMEVVTIVRFQNTVYSPIWTGRSGLQTSIHRK
jgi:hypothetical protein